MEEVTLMHPGVIAAWYLRRSLVKNKDKCKTEWQDAVMQGEVFFTWSQGPTTFQRCLPAFHNLLPLISHRESPSSDQHIILNNFYKEHTVSGS